MIETLTYNPKMFESIVLMHKSQGYPDMQCITIDSLPALGTVAFDFKEDNGKPVAAAFLRMVEGGYAQIDTLVSNAATPSEMRHEGISKCVDKLIQEAKNLKLHGILATTKDETTITRALSLGFHVVTDHKVIALSLKEPSVNG